MHVLFVSIDPLIATALDPLLDLLESGMTKPLITCLGRGTESLPIKSLGVPLLRIRIAAPEPPAASFFWKGNQLDSLGFTSGIGASSNAVR